MGKSLGFGGQIGFSIDESGFKRHVAGARGMVWGDSYEHG